MGRLLLHSAVILWLVQTVCTHGYGAVSGASTGHGPQPNGHKPQNGGGVGRMLLPSKGVGHTMGPQNGHGGYPSKGIGYGPTAGVSGSNGAKSNGYGAAAGVASRRMMKGYGAAAAAANGQGSNKPQGYGGQAGQANGHQMKGNGYGAQAGGFGGKATKGLGYGTAGVLGGNGANGQGAAGLPSGNGVRTNGQGGVGGKPMKGYGRPSYGAGPGVGVGASRGLGVPQLARNQGRGYNNNGYNGYGAQPMGGYGGQAGQANGHQMKGNGYNGGYGHAGSSLGPRYGNGGMKGPKQGSSGVAGVPNGHGAKANGYGSFLNGHGNKPKGYGASRGGAVRPQPGFGNGAVHPGYGNKPNGHGVRNGAVLGGYGGGSQSQTTKGVGALLPSQGAKIPGTGYGGPAGGTKAANAGYGMMPNGKSTMGAGATKGLKGGVFAPAQPSAGPQELAHGALSGLPVAPEMTQGQSYKQTPLILQGTPEPVPAFAHGIDPQAGLESIPEPGLVGPQGNLLKLFTPVSAPVVPQSNPEAEPASNQGYVTGSAVPEQKGAETDVAFGVDSTTEAEVSAENTKADPETVSVNIAASLIPEDTLSVAVPEPEKETDIQSQPEAAPLFSLGVNGLHAEQTGATENREASLSKGQGAKSAKPDCGPSGIPNGQWIKIPRPDYNAGAGGSTGMKTKGYGAGAGVDNRYGAKPNGYGANAGGFPNGGGAKASKPGYGAGGYAVPGLSHGYGTGRRFPYAGNPKQPGYGQGAYLGAGYGNAYGGFGNGYIAGVQPDYASLGQGVPNADAQPGVAPQLPYNGAPHFPAGLDGVSQFEPQSAGLVPNGNLGSMYDGMGGVPFGGQTLGMGAEKSSKKYGIGGLQFGGQPLIPGATGAGKYGYNGFPSNGQHLGHGGNGHIPGKYGYGRMPFEAQQAGLSPEAKSAGKYGLPGSPYQPETLGLGHIGQLAGNYDNQGLHHSQPLESVSEAIAGVGHDAAGLPYESLPSELHSPEKSSMKAQLLAPAAAHESEGLSMDGYDNVDYINGHVQPDAPSPTLLSAPSLTDDMGPAVGVEDLPESMGPVNLGLDSAPATETQGVVQVEEEPEDLPRQIHIQQQLKLHFHPQEAKTSKHDLSGFFGNSGYQG